MLQLYYKPSCPYCQRVLVANEAIQAPLKLQNVLENTAFMTELIEKGGKRQVPFLHDTERNVLMYESLDIIEYLRQNYGTDVPVTVPPVGNVCPIDE